MTKTLDAHIFLVLLEQGLINGVSENKKTVSKLFFKKEKFDQKK